MSDENQLEAIRLPGLSRFDSQGMSRILEVAHKIGGVQIACGMREAVEDFVETLKFGLVEVVYEWAKGTSFKDITSLTSVQEGTVCFDNTAV